MAKLETVYGDLLKMAEEGQFNIIVHGCNCFCTMGAGIARTIADRYPMAYDADRETHPGSILKMGTFTKADTGKFLIVNAYTQYAPGGGEDVFEYAAFKVILRKLSHMATRRPGTLKFGLPLIGGGLAGGDPKAIVEIMEEFAKDLGDTATATLVLYKPN